MNYLNALKVMAVIVLLMVVSSINAQDTKDVQESGQFITFVKIDGKTCVSTNREEFEQLKALSLLIDAMKQARANGTIDSTQYAEKTASYFKDARSTGIIIR